jgi:capsular exopolysaccharide synthesis family protein
MSRIREALKRAAEERSAQTGGRSEDFVDILEGPPASRVTSTDLGKLDLPRGVEFANPDLNILFAECRKVRWHFEPRFSVFANEASDRGGAEKFRTLRSRLYQISATRPLRRLLLTSSVPQEGKTFVAANLAQSFIRQADRRVLLIDADLRASRLNLTLGALNEPGLSDYLLGEAAITKVLQVGEEKNLCFIPGGKLVSNPSELLHSEKMKSFLDRMGQIFDWVIVDSPPAIVVHDASILADMCDGVLFVVRAGATEFQAAQRAAAEFPEGKLLGVVLNRADQAEAYGADYYGYSKEDGEDEETNDE